jgi:hypothetical protein
MLHLLNNVTLLGFIKRMRQRCSIKILQVPTRIIIGSRIRSVDLQRPTPHIPFDDDRKKMHGLSMQENALLDQYNNLLGMREPLKA